MQAENAADKDHKDAASANAYLEKEIQRVKFALQEQNNELNKGTSNALNRFEQNLKRSGLTLNEQRIQMDEYRKSLLMFKSCDFIYKYWSTEILTYTIFRSDFALISSLILDLDFFIFSL